MVATDEIWAWLHWLFAKYEEFPVISTLIVLMIVDILSGAAAAMIGGRLSSKAGWPGMLKKAATLLIVGVAAVLERLQSDIPLSKLTAAFFIVNEGISILENARKCGVPIPEFLARSLDNLLHKTEAAASVTETETVTTTKIVTKPAVNAGPPASSDPQIPTPLPAAVPAVATVDVKMVTPTPAASPASPTKIN